MLGSNPIFRKT